LHLSLHNRANRLRHRSPYLRSQPRPL
jgi:hypothetical protein